jgi:hypothetical protein
MKLERIEIPKNKEIHFIDMTHIILIMKATGVIFIKHDYEEESLEIFFMGTEEEAQDLFIKLKTLFKKHNNKFIEKENIILNAENIMNVIFSDDMYEETYWSIDFKGLYSVQRFSIDTVIEFAGSDIIEFNKEDFRKVIDHE